MLWVAVCDDQTTMLCEIEDNIYELSKKYKIELSVEVFSSGEEILAYMNTGQRYDIIFMDIEMRGINGIDTAMQIRDMDLSAQIIYITAHETYMRDAFRVSPIGFLSKPINTMELDEAFRNALKYVRYQDDYYTFEYKKMGYKVPVKDIIYIQSNRKEVNIVCVDRCYAKSGTLSTVEHELSKYSSQIFKIHRSYAVNLRHITKFTYVDVTVSNGESLSISIGYRKKTREKMTNFWRQ